MNKDFRIFYLAFVLVIFSMCTTIPKSSVSSTIETCEDLLVAMNKKYKGKWFDQFTFIQETIRINENGKEGKKSIWYEAIDYPKKFRIDYGPITNGNTTIYDKDSAWVFRDYKLKKTEYMPKEFLLMKGGLYHLTTKETIEALSGYGYDCDKFRTAELNQRKVYVIGADRGDLKSKQFWIDAEHFYMVRRINTQQGKVVDVVYSDHVFSNGGWVEQVVKFWVDEKYVQKELYKEINTNPQLGAEQFDPNSYGEIKHWSEQD
ncbi:MAG: hypothetical protein GY810_01555 [Aureispira sp.]|nr:hypothetical protein [Aureispira sp.]